jgi:hypothetical protein
MECLSKNGKADQIAAEHTRGETMGAQNRRGETIAWFGVLLPVGALLVYGTLAFVAFVSPTVAGAISIDKMLLVVIALSPAAYVAGLVFSAVALLRHDVRLVALAGVALNIVMPALLLYFGRAFLVEFRLMVW